MQRVTKHRIVCTLTVIGLGMLLIVAGICAVQTISCKIHLKKLLQTAEAKGTDIKQPYFYLQPTYVPETALEEAMAVEIQNHPYEYYTVPSYQNPFPQIHEGSSSNKKIYNDLLRDYLKEKEEELRNCLQSQIEDEYMQPI